MHSAYVNEVLFLPFIGKDLVSKSTGQRAKTDEKTVDFCCSPSYTTDFSPLFIKGGLISKGIFNLV